MSAHAWITLGIVAGAVLRAFDAADPAILAARMTRPTGCVHTFRFPAAFHDPMTPVLQTKERCP